MKTSLSCLFHFRETSCSLPRGERVGLGVGWVVGCGWCDAVGAMELVAAVARNKGGCLAGHG